MRQTPARAHADAASGMPALNALSDWTWPSLSTYRVASTASNIVDPSAKRKLLLCHRYAGEQVGKRATCVPSPWCSNLPFKRTASQATRVPFINLHDDLPSEQTATPAA